MPTITVSIPPNIKKQAPFAAALFTSEPLLLTLELRVDGVGRPFGLEVGGTALPSATTQQVDVDGPLDVTILGWGTASNGAKVKLSVLTQQASDEGTVII